MNAPEEALDGAAVALVALATPGVTEALLAASPAHVIDRSGLLDPEVERLPGYSGVGW